MAGVSSFKPQVREKIAALEEAHRPLDAHWNHPSKYRLDSRHSDGKYKHHITNLEEIYNEHRKQQPVSYHFHVESPGTALYGVRGLLSTVPGVDEKKKRREDRWVDNHQKYAVLADPTMIDYDRLPSRSTTIRKSVSNDQLDFIQTMNNQSPGKSRKLQTFGGNSSMPFDMITQPTAQSMDPTTAAGKESSRCYNEQYTEQDLIMLDMYRLDARQDEIYKSFVHLLSEFDQHDAKKIVEDALRDARKNDLMIYYTGTELQSNDDEE